MIILISLLSAFYTNAIAQTQNLETQPLTISTAQGEFAFSVEVADEPRERNIGLMNRSKLDPLRGMLFAFDQPQVITMWMKNTLISLDMIFIDREGVVKNIAERTTPHSLAVISSGEPVSFVLELGGGMAAYIGLASGDRVKHQMLGNGSN